MFIPFAGQWINPAHITRMVYVENQRLTLFMADGLDGLTEKGTAGDEMFKRIITSEFGGLVTVGVETRSRAVTIEAAPFPHDKTEITFKEPPLQPKKGRRK